MAIYLAQAVREDGHHATIAGTIGEATVRLRADAQMSLPIDQEHGQSEGTLHAEAHDVGIELGVGHIILAHGNAGSPTVRNSCPRKCKLVITSPSRIDKLISVPGSAANARSDVL